MEQTNTPNSTDLVIPCLHTVGKNKNKAGYTQAKKDDTYCCHKYYYSQNDLKDVI